MKTNLLKENSTVNEIVKKFGDFIPDKVTIEELGINNSLAIKLMKDAGWD